MKRTGRLAALILSTSFFWISGENTARAASASVGVSIHFEVAPARLFEAPGISAKTVRLCESLQSRIADIWSGKARQPTVNCQSPASAPLILTGTEGSGLVVRP